MDPAANGKTSPIRQSVAVTASTPATLVAPGYCTGRNCWPAIPTVSAHLSSGQGLCGEVELHVIMIGLGWGVTLQYSAAGSTGHMDNPPRPANPTTPFVVSPQLLVLTLCLPRRSPIQSRFLSQPNLPLPSGHHIWCSSGMTATPLVPCSHVTAYINHKLLEKLVNCKALRTHGGRAFPCLVLAICCS